MRFRVARCEMLEARGQRRDVRGEGRGVSGESADARGKWRGVAGWVGVLCYLPFAFSLLFGQTVVAQVLPVGDLMEEQLRIQQLLQGSEFSSFTNRPIWQGVYDQTMKEAEDERGWWNRNIAPPSLDLGYSIQIGAFHPTFKSTHNSTVPYGDNNGAAWYGRGFNREMELGGWITSDYVTLTLRPHFIYQQNREFEVPRFIPRDEIGRIRYVSEAIGDIIDRPFRFGPDYFYTSDWGNSSIRLHYEAIEIGYSNEPLWWGGNVKYPLMMSNNAPGVKHYFIGTRKPLHIPYLGSIEFRWMLGRPEDSGYFDQPEEYQQDRFLNALNLTYSPKWIPNFHIGLTRSFHSYIGENGVLWKDITAIFDPYYLKNLIEKRGELSEITPRNELKSFYARWVWPESHIEIYGEFFRDDFSWDSRDFMMEPLNNSGYAFGFQKLFFAPLAKMYRANVEFTNMTPSFLEEVRPQSYYYTDNVIRQGHTNKGQLLGAAIGPGSNSQFIGLDAFSENGRYGIYMRRLADNNHFHYEYDRALNRPEEYRQGFGDYWRNRTDLTIGSTFLYDFGPVVFTGNISWTKLFNYGRNDYGLFGGISIVDFEKHDLINWQYQFGLQVKW